MVNSVAEDNFEYLFNYFNKMVTVSEHDFSVFKEKVQLKKFAKKDFLTKAGAIEQNIYFIIKGLVRIFYTKDKQQFTFDLVADGSFTGSMCSFLSQSPSLFSVELLEPTTVFFISKNDLEELFDTSKNWEKIGRVIMAHFLMLQEKDIMDEIRYTVKQRFVNFNKEHPDLVLRVPQKYLASYLKIKPETFSRMKHLLLEKNIEKAK
jgi:CRP-like cAMP-binding protein